jgi:hypothetical protein
MIQELVSSGARTTGMLEGGRPPIEAFATVIRMQQPHKKQNLLRHCAVKDFFLSKVHIIEKIFLPLSKKLDVLC